MRRWKDRVSAQENSVSPEMEEEEDIAEYLE